MEGEGLQSPCSSLKVGEVMEDAHKPTLTQANIGEIESPLETTTAGGGSGSQRPETSIQDLPPELLLCLFEYLSVKELCLSVAPVCKRWSMLSKHPCLWKQLTFGRNDVSTEKVCELIRRSPLLRELFLYCRRDTNAILRAAFAACHHLHTLKIVSCRGSRTVRPISSFTLSRIIRKRAKLHYFVLHGTRVDKPSFYTLLREHNFIKIGWYLP
jgi:hypothetical protein